MFLMQHAWLVMVIGTVIQVPLLWRRLRPQIAVHPELEPGYRHLLWWGTFWFCLPWLVMGIGCTVGGIQSFLAFFYPAKGGPFVWAFWVVAYAEFLLLGYWAIWGRGAEILIRYPSLVNYRIGSIRSMRRVLIVVAGLAMVWNAGILIWLA
jgi:hypothetical protein